VLFAVAVTNFDELLFSLKQQHTERLSVSHERNFIRRGSLKLHIIPFVIEARLQVSLLKNNLIVFFNFSRILALRVIKGIALIHAISLRIILVINRIWIRVDRRHVVAQNEGQKQIHHHVALLPSLASPVCSSSLSSLAITFARS